MFLTCIHDGKKLISEIEDDPTTNEARYLVPIPGQANEIPGQANPVVTFSMGGAASTHRHKGQQYVNHPTPLETTQPPLNHGLDTSEARLRERVKEMRCLYQLGDLVHQSGKATTTLQSMVDLLPPAWLYPAVTSAVLTLRQPPRASIASKTFRAAVAASPFRTMIGLVCPPSPLPQTLSMPVHCEHVCVGTIDIHVHVPQPDAPGGQGPFLPEEIKLLTRVADKIGEYLTRAAQHDALLEREKELACLHRLADCFIGAGDRGLRKFFKVVVHELQQSFQFPSVCDAQIVFGGKCTPLVCR